MMFRFGTLSFLQSFRVKRVSPGFALGITLLFGISMANLPAGGMISLGAWTYGAGASDSFWVKTAFDATSPLVLKPPTAVTPCVPKENKLVDGVPGIMDCPLQELVQTKVLHVIDVIHDVDDTFDMEVVVALMKNKTYDSLPSPLSPKTVTTAGYHMSLAMIKLKDHPGKLVILKWYRFEYALHASWIKENLIRGIAHQPYWISAKQVTVKCLHYVIERLPGNVFLYSYWAGGGGEIKKANAKTRSSTGNADKETRHKGYRFIENFGPKTNVRNEFNIWSEDHVEDTEGPIYGWDINHVKDSLRVYAMGKSGAKSQDSWPFSFKLVYPSVLDNIVIPIMTTYDLFGSLWIGRTRTGKSTITKIMMLTASAHQIKKHKRHDLKPSFSTAVNLDFFRLEPGSRFKPVCMDDIALNKMTPGDFKATINPMEDDALVWARWGGSSTDINQAVCGCINPYKKKAEPPLSDSTIREAILLKKFLEMIEENWPAGSTEADIEAYLERCHIVLFTDAWIYFLKAKSNLEELVPRWPYPDPKRKDIFIKEATSIMKKFKRDKDYKPEGYDDDFLWGVKLCDYVSTGAVPPRTRTIMQEGLPDRYIHPDFDDVMLGVDEAAVVVPDMAYGGLGMAGLEDDPDFENGFAGFDDDQANPLPPQGPLPAAAAANDGVGNGGGDSPIGAIDLDSPIRPIKEEHASQGAVRKWRNKIAKVSNSGPITLSP